MALPAPRSNLRTHASKQSSPVVATDAALAPARGIILGLGIALGVFWGPVVAGAIWLLG